MISLSLDRGIELLVFIFTLLKELGEDGCPEFAIFLKAKWVNHLQSSNSEDQQTKKSACAGY